MAAETLTTQSAAGPLSALHQPTEASSCRGIVFALHGGAYTARYFHEQHAPDLSLLATLSVVGFDVIALDRPGYGAAADWAREGLTLQQQVPLVADAINALSSSRANIPIFLVGHSIGAMVAAGIAATHSLDRLDAVSMCGAGTVQDPEIRDFFHALLPSDHSPVAPPAAARRMILFGPEWTIDPRVVEADAAVDVGIPAKEYVSTQDWVDTFSQWGPDITCPVQFVLGEYDRIWRASPEALCRARQLLPHAPQVDAAIQRAAGHSVDQHRVALAHHLRVAGFFCETAALG